MISCPQDPGGSLSGVTAWSWDLPTQRNETAGGSCPALPTDSLCYNTRKGLHAPCSDARRDRTFVELLPDRSRWQVPGDFSDLRTPGEGLSRSRAETARPRWKIQVGKLTARSLYGSYSSMTIPQGMRPTVTESGSPTLCESIMRSGAALP